MSCEKYFSEQLHARGFRLTPQREMVLSVMHRIEDFATADEILGRVHALSSSVDVSTVYRTLDLLQDVHLVACVEPGDGKRRYKLLGVHRPHIHLVCRSCGKVMGADVENARVLITCLRDRHGFEVDIDHLSVPGLCQECSSSRHRDSDRGR